MDKGKDLIQRIFTRQNFDFVINSNRITITRSSKGNSALTKQLTLSSVVAFICIILFFVNKYLGIFVFIGSAAAVFKTVIDMKQRESETKGKSINIDETEVRIRNKYKSRSMLIDDVKSIDIRIKQVDQVANGVMYLNSISQGSLELFEFFSYSKEIVLSDLQEVGDFLNQHYFNNRAEFEPIRN